MTRVLKTYPDYILKCDLCEALHCEVALLETNRWSGRKIKACFSCLLEATDLFEIKGELA